VNITKKALRKKIYTALIAAKAARFPGVQGRIPNFKGAETAATLLATLPEWQTARTVKINPDSPQRPVRAAALRAGKVLFLPCPRLKEEKPFIRLDPARLGPRTLWHASSIKGAFELGEPVGFDELPPIDLIVTGCVGVDAAGGRLGKGGGYSDLEYAMLREEGLVTEDTPILTTVHSSQVVDAVPMNEHDISLDRYVTPEGVVDCVRKHSRPTGVLWEHLDSAKIAAIPALQGRQGDTS
jgi:5-formyltetrahydrofolate cyclo-ligase